MIDKLERFREAQRVQINHNRPESDDYKRESTHHEISAESDLKERQNDQS